MGVWERSPAGIEISMRDPGLLGDFRRALPDFAPEDDVGSPYCVRLYVVDGHLGGPRGLAAARRMLAERGLRLILDFVPNHVAPDHPWVREHPEHFVQGTADDARSDPASFVELAGKVFARGRDPFFPAWPDVLQLNAFRPGLRLAVIETLSEISGQCDGVRCDMAMLMLNQVFERTWGARAGPRPADDYWATVIPATRRRQPQFRFIAEAYWDLEWELQQQGFDTATTRSSTTGWGAGTRRACASISSPTAPTRRRWSASSRTTTSRGRPRPSRPGRSEPRRWRCSRSPA
jgi:hypothetical protein